MPDDAPSTARAQLAALVAADGADLRVLNRLPVGDDARRAAVLILFGVLDARPSDRAAQDAAVSADLDVLLLARAETLRSHPGQIAFPGGRAEPADAHPAATALREAREETGLDIEGVEVLGTLGEVPLARSGHLVTPVIGWWRRPSPVGVVDVAESAAVFRIPVADLLDPANRGVTVLHAGGAQRRGPAFRLRDGRVLWGFTAVLLDAIFDALGWTEPWDHSRELPLPS
ncbi:CoA pyrophosphatase [Microbacterium sp. SORGH_AS_0888]|uniref:NUDIX hydrolase n=1 Tax=Microbacterium sp. SORGH_AS_0888 TaxID=3041791 RepID=UPI002784F1EC|nr:CoA pyrophosphatase [Microbacterium sp. SORGH_AS_0888]MDQ1130826.1 8-oxo-dGTP pyrophosphatase MutT (NUDIX family) [Microbacterium sp. SORGH_AS_0888]